MPVRRWALWWLRLIPLLAQYFKNQGIGGGWEMAFLIIGALGFLWMGFWVFMRMRNPRSRST